MRIVCLSRRFGAVILAATLIVTPSFPVIAQDATPAGSPSPVTALDPALVTGTWQSLGDSTNRSQAEGPRLSGNPVLAWKAPVVGGMYGQPAIGDHILVAIGDQEIAVHDRATGELLWSHPYLSWGSGAALVDGLVITPGYEDGVTAWDAATGERVWNYQFRPGQEETIEDESPNRIADMKLYDGELYVHGGLYGDIAVLDPATGAEQRRFETVSGISGSLALADGVLYYQNDAWLNFPGDDPNVKSALHALDARTGQELWSVDTPSDYWVFPVIVIDDVLLVGGSAMDSGRGSYTAFDPATGEELWRLDLPFATYASSAAAGDGMLFALGGGNNTITAIDVQTGEPVWQLNTRGGTWAIPALVDGVLYAPIDGQGVIAVDASNGQELWRFSTDAFGEGIGSLSYADGSVYVWAGSSLIALAGDGGTVEPVGVAPGFPAAPVVAADTEQFLTQVGQLETPEPFSTPEGIAVAPDGSIFVVDVFNNRFQIFNPDGTFDRVWGKAGSGPGEFSFFEPDGGFVADAAFAPNGDLYVADWFNGRVQQFDADLTFLREWSVTPSSGEPGRPVSLDVDAERGRVYVMDDNSGVLLIYDLGGNLAAEWGADSPIGPGGVAVAPDGSVYVAQVYAGLIRQFSPGGALVREFGGIGTAPGRIAAPFGIAVDADGNLYMTDYSLDRVQVFAPDGTVIGVYGESAESEGKLSNPVFVEPLPDGRVLVSNEGNNAVVVLAPGADLALPTASPTA